MIDSLIIDNLDETANELTRQLTPLGRIERCGEGSAGLTAYCKAWDRGAGFHLVFIGHAVPGIGGLDLLKAIRAIEESRGRTMCKIVMLSGAVTPTFVKLVFRRNADALLRIPFTGRDVVKVLGVLGLEYPPPAGHPTRALFPHSPEHLVLRYGELAAGPSGAAEGSATLRSQVLGVLTRCPNGGERTPQCQVARLLPSRNPAIDQLCSWIDELSVDTMQQIINGCRRCFTDRYLERGGAGGGRPAAT